MYNVRVVKKTNRIGNSSFVVEVKHFPQSAWVEYNDHCFYNEEEALNVAKCIWVTTIITEEVVFMGKEE